MKKYYTVKEAAKIIGVSTNTIYKYLQEGTLPAKRIGAGRFKIFQSSLLPYMGGVIDTSSVSAEPSAFIFKDQTQSMPVREDFGAKVEIDKTVASGISGELEREITPGVSDAIFFRIFKAVSFLGLGIIYFFGLSDLFKFDGVLLDLSGSVIFSTLPYLLIVVGLLNLTEVVNPKGFEKAHLLVDFFVVMVTGYFCFISVITREYSLLAPVTSFFLMALTHLVGGDQWGKTKSTFFDTFFRFLLYTVIIEGIVILFNPSLVPSDIIANFIFEKRELWILIWVTLLLAPFIYILSLGRNSFLRTPYVIFVSVVFFVFAIKLTYVSRWDVSYINFITGVFGVFLGWWMDSGRILDWGKVKTIVFSFFWVSGTLVVGLYGLSISRSKIKEEAQFNLNELAVRASEKINVSFEERSGLMVSYSGTPEIKTIFDSKDSESATSMAREIYEKLDDVERVLIYSEEGVVLGVYPRNTLYQGTNFSSRPYFSETQDTYRSVVSPIFNDVLGKPAVIQTEPVFENNRFVGMIGVSLDLAKLSKNYQFNLNLGNKIKGVDQNGVVVFDPDEDVIGTRSVDFAISGDTENIISAKQNSSIANWDVVVYSSITPLLSGTTNMNLILSLLFIANSFFSISAGIISTTKGTTKSKHLGDLVLGSLNTQQHSGVLQTT